MACIECSCVAASPELLLPGCTHHPALLTPDCSDLGRGKESSNTERHPSSVKPLGKKVHSNAVNTKDVI